MEEIAVVYARSLFEAALDADKLDLVREQLGEFADALDGDRQLQVFFFSPYFSTQEKKDGLHRAVEGAEELFLNFLELLLENHRMPAIFRIRRNYDHLWEAHNRLLPVEVTSADRARRADRAWDRRPDRRADRPQGGALRERGAGHPRRHRRPRRQPGARRIDPQPPGDPSQAGRPGLAGAIFQGANESNHADQA